MAETATKKPQTTAPEPIQWQPGQYWTPGMPIPPDAQITPHEGGMATLERRADPGFDKDLREKVLRQLDDAFTRAFKEDSVEHPGGQRPYALLVNPGFTHYFPNVDSWGELNPPCRVREVDGRDERFKLPTAVRVGPEGRQVKALFITEAPKPNAADGGTW